MTIGTDIPNLQLIELTPEDADAYYDLVDRNRGHLTRHCDYQDLGEATPGSVAAKLTDGDFQDLGEATPGSLAAEFSNPDDRIARFGIWLDGQLIGRADLNQRTPEIFILGYWLGGADLNQCTPGNFVLGYWLGGEFTGKGYATVACKALIAYGRAELNATTIYAGVTKGNVKSEALLGRLGFRAIADRGTYTRFRLPLT